MTMPNMAGYRIGTNLATVKVTIAGDQKTRVLVVSTVSILKLLTAWLFGGCVVVSEVTLFEAPAEGTKALPRFLILAR